MSEHEKFVELCALYTSGSLSDDQLTRLNEHLEACGDCRQALQQFQEIEVMGLPAVAPDFAAELPNNDRKWVADRREQKLLARIKGEIVARQPDAGEDMTRAHAPIPVGRKILAPALEAFGYVRALLPYAAAVLFTASIGFYSYHLGAKKVADASEPKLRQVQARADSLEMTIAELLRDRESVNAKLQESARAGSALTEKIKLQLSEIALLEEEKKKLTDADQVAEEKALALDSERDALNRRLAEAQASLAAMQKHLDAVREEQTNELFRDTTVDTRLDELSAALKDRDQTIQQQRDLLAYDRDIRDLIGTRDLYVAEVTDVGRDGETKKPFARVFFTRGKSLIFYAYDLDKQPGVHRASVFQAWGRRGSDFDQALPLGILYLDSSSNKRWVLKFDDPQALAKIDAVFVTIEPKVGSPKPTGKPLLFAYLKVEPNHP